MDQDDDGFWVEVNSLSEIPQELHSAYSKAPFRECVVCELPLVDSEYYSIQNLKNGGEIILEIAVCSTCSAEQSKEFSKESKATLAEIMNEVVNKKLGATACGLCSKAFDQITKHSRMGLCCGEFLILQFVLCDSCSDGLNQRLSKTTRDAQGEFIRKHIPGIPADFDLKPSGMF